MAGSKDPGPAARLVAANLKHIRQERGLGFAELARRLDAAGHHVADTALMKTENGTRRATVDDLAALAVALGVTPNRLLLPPADGSGPEDGEPAPWGKEPARSLWAWATGEIPLGHPPASAKTSRAERGGEVAFFRENRGQHWNAPPPPPPASAGAAANQVLALNGLAALVQVAFGAGYTTADIRGIIESALLAALLHPDPASATVRIGVSEGRITIWNDLPGSPGEQEAD
jgi:transcriptional regulator with XRE-family HTH domain